MAQNMSNPMMLSLMDNFHYLYSLPLLPTLLHLKFYPPSYFFSPYPHFKSLQPLNIHIRQCPYLCCYIVSATLHIKDFRILFFSSKFILLVNSLLLSIKAFLAISILLRMSILTISIFHYQTSKISELFYLLQHLSIYTNFPFHLSVFTNTHHFCLFDIDPYCNIKSKNTK